MADRTAAFLKHVDDVVFTAQSSAWVMGMQYYAHAGQAPEEGDVEGGQDAEEGGAGAPGAAGFGVAAVGVAVAATTGATGEPDDRVQRRGR